MSQENVELVRRGHDLVGRADIAGLLDLIGPEFELHENVLAPDAAVYHGPDGLRKWLEASQEAFTDFRFEAERFIESGDWVFASVRAHGRGRGSGAPFTASYVTAFKIRHGKFVFAASYGDLSEALEAAGLSESAMSRENVEALRRLYQEWARGDLWALRDVADPNIEWEWAAGLASVIGGPRVCRGLDEIGAATLEWLAAWDSYWMTAEDFIEAGDEIVVFMQLHARTASTDTVVEQRVAAVWTFRNGKAVRVRYYEDKSEALEAVGLSE